MSERRLRTEQRRRRARAKFWDTYGERIRLTLIATAMFLAATWIAKAALG